MGGGGGERVRSLVCSAVLAIAGVRSNKEEDPEMNNNYVNLSDHVYVSIVKLRKQSVCCSMVGNGRSP